MKCLFCLNLPLQFCFRRWWSGPDITRCNNTFQDSTVYAFRRWYRLQFELGFLPTPTGKTLQRELRLGDLSPEGNPLQIKTVHGEL